MIFYFIYLLSHQRHIHNIPTYYINLKIVCNVFTGVNILHDIVAQPKQKHNT